MNEYIQEEELVLIKQLSANVESAAKQCEIAGFVAQKSHADKRAAEAELRAAQAEYHGQIMKLLWKYKLSGEDSFRQSDGMIIKGEKDESKKNDTGSESEESS